jgi:hypothetical protein
MCVCKYVNEMSCLYLSFIIFFFIARIQIWPHIKLMIIFSLVIPYFDGAFYVYNHLVRPYLLLNPQVIVDEFNKWMVLLCKRDHFLAEAERYIKGNEPEALEKLIDKEVWTSWLLGLSHNLSNLDILE